VASLLFHIDQIARVRRRNVVWIAFEYDSPGGVENMPRSMKIIRNKIVGWLEKQKISYEPCFGIFDGALEERYRGDLFVEIKVRIKDPYFIELEKIIENEDGSPKVDGVLMYILPRKIADKNSIYYKSIIG
jgi:hypothetical protein